MHFRHPELATYYDTMPRPMESAGVEPKRRGDSIIRLMAMVDRFALSEWDAGGSLPQQGDFNWEPKSKELTEIIEHIMAPHHREQLREWYRDVHQMNPTATAFRDWVEAKIGESLKPQQPGTGQPATRPVVEPKGSDKPQPEAEGRPR
jgi:hypothetical protein